MSYNLTNENQEDTPMLTKGDLVVSSFALAETFNSYLQSYNEEDYGEMTKEEMETSMHRLRVAFIKIDSMLGAMDEQIEDAEVISSEAPEVTDDNKGEESSP